MQLEKHVNNYGIDNVMEKVKLGTKFDDCKVDF